MSHESTTSSAPALSKLARGGTFAMVGTAAGSVLGFALTLVVTRGLSTISAGEFFTATAVFTVLQTVFSFGVGAGLVRFIPRLGALGRSNDIPALLVIAIVPVAVLAVLGSAGLWFAAPAVAGHVGHGDGQATEQSLRLLAVLLLPGTLEIALVEATRGFGSIRGYVLIQQLALPFARPLLVGLAVVLQLPLWAVVLAWMIPLVMALALAAILVGRRLSAQFGRAWAWPQPSVSKKSLAVEYWSFTSARGVALTMEILLVWLDVILVAALVSPAQAAIYTAASRFVMAGTVVLQALRLTIASDISASLARRDYEKVSELYRVASQWVVTSSWPLYLLMAIFAAPVLGIFGPEYSHGHVAMTILCLAMLVNLAAGNVGTVLLMGGNSMWVLGDKAASLALNVVANLVLVPRLGITGAAIAWAATILLDSSLAFAQVRWGMGIAGRLNGLALSAVLATGCFGLLPLAVRAWLGDSFSTLVVAGILACVVYLPLAWLLRARLGLDVLASALLSRRGPAVESKPVGPQP